jgi:hypothetical protein
MKTVALLSFLLSFSASASGTAWQNLLSIGDLYTLSQTLTLDLKAKGTVSVRKATAFTLESITPLDEISVVDYVLTAKTCGHPDLEGDLTMVLPAGNSPTSKAEVGVYLNKNCSLEVLVETKDLAKPSFFLKTR